MTLYYAMPVINDPSTMGPRTFHSQPSSCASRAFAPCSRSSCDPFFVILLAFLFGPLIVPLLLSIAAVLFFVIRIFVSVAFWCFVAKAVGNIFNAMSCDETESGAQSGCHMLRKMKAAYFKRAAFDKLRRACECAPASTDNNRDQCACPATTAKPGATVRDQLKAEEKAPIDHSSVSVEKTSDAITIVVAVPGIREDDVNISAQDNVLKVQGTSTKAGGRTFTVDRRILLPSVADLDTATATYEHGEVTIAIARKQNRRIPVHCVAAEDKKAAGRTSTSDEPPLQRKSAARPVDEQVEPTVEPTVTAEAGEAVTKGATPTESSDEWEALPHDEASSDC